MIPPLQAYCHISKTHCHIHTMVNKEGKIRRGGGREEGTVLALELIIDGDAIILPTLLT